MKRHLWRIFSIAICMGIMISCTACQSVIGSSKNITELNQAYITELNQAYNGSVLKITATEIKAVESPSGETDEIIIGVKFVIENISNKDWVFARRGITAYVDDIAKTETINKQNFGDTLTGTIAPGKFAIGYYCVKASKNAERIEIHFIEDYKEKKAMFSFDIPDIENAE